MSTFYESLSYWDNIAFKHRKKAFKRGKPCAVCGKMYKPSEMMVAHIIPVRELSDYDALYDTTNWEVRCIYCERRLNTEETLRKSRLKTMAESRTPGIVPRYEMDIYLAYDELIKSIWRRATAGMRLDKRHRRSAYWGRIEAEVRKADKMTLAKATARYVLDNNGEIPTREEVYKQLEKDAETLMLFETHGKFKAEKGQNGA